MHQYANRPAQQGGADLAHTVEPTPSSELSESLSAGLAALLAHSILRPKLAIGSTDDPVETEADRAADAVMRMSDHDPEGLDRSPVSGTTDTIRRKCEECAEEEERLVRRKPVSGTDTPAVTSLTELGIGPGRPLTRWERSFFEPRFGQDFSAVRLHTDAAAQQSARTISARAFAVGNDIVFGDGQYQPETDSGKRLMAHELAHVVQADSGPGNAGVIRRQPDEEDEDVAKPGAAKPVICPGGAVPLNGVCMSDEILEALPQANFDMRLAQSIVRKNDLEKVMRARRRERTTKKFSTDNPNSHLHNYKVALDEYIGNPNQQTKRHYNSAKCLLQSYYTHQIALYKGGGTYGDKNDIATFQDLVRAQAPDIAESGQQDVNEIVSAPSWSPDQKAQMDELKRDIAGWTDDEQKVARNILWQWFELERKGQHPSGAKRIIISMAERQLEQSLRYADRARAEDCKRRPMGTVEKMYRLHGIDRCKPWFDDANAPNSTILHGPSELHHFRMQMSIRLSEDESPKSLVLECIKQYRRQTNTGEQLRAMRAQALVGLGMHWTGVATAGGEALGQKPPMTATEVSDLPTGAAASVAEVPAGAVEPQTGTLASPFDEQSALPPGSVFELQPPATLSPQDPVSAPPALPSAPSASSATFDPPMPVGAAASSQSVFSNPLELQDPLPPGSVFALEQPETEPVGPGSGGPMRAPPGGGNRTGMTATEKTVTPHKPSNPVVEVLPRSTVPMSDFETPEPGHYIVRKPPDAATQRQIEAAAGRTTDGRFRDANTGRALNDGEAVWGHAPDFQFKPMRDLFEKMGKTQAEFDAFYRDPAKWQIEYGPTNSGRTFDRVPRGRPVH